MTYLFRYDDNVATAQTLVANVRVSSSHLHRRSMLCAHNQGVSAEFAMLLVRRPLAEALAATLLGAPHRQPERSLVFHFTSAAPETDHAALPPSETRAEPRTDSDTKDSKRACLALPVSNAPLGLPAEGPAGSVLPGPLRDRRDRFRPLSHPAVAVLVFLARAAWAGSVARRRVPGGGVCRVNPSLPRAGRTR